MVLVTVASSLIAYQVHYLTHRDDPYFVYSVLELVQFSVQAILNTTVAFLVTFYCVRQKTWTAIPIIAVAVLIRWGHVFVIYDEPTITVDFSFLDFDLVSVWWRPIAFEFLFLTLCLTQMWREGPSKPPAD